jgi:uncharacterized membrane protein
MATVAPEVLRNIPLFKLLDDQEIKLLADELDVQKFLAGQMIISQNDSGGTMFLVKTGRVQIFLYDKAGEYVDLGVIETDGLFGELSLLDNEPRSASAKAIENTEVIIIDRNDLQLLLQSHPDAGLSMLEILGRRIRATNTVVQGRVTRNANEEMPAPTGFGERLSDLLTYVAGDIRFVYFSAIWFFVWIVWNTNIIPGLKPFDPFPFGLLTMVVSLEAIFLSLFVLISQNRQASREKVRNDVEYETNIKAEIEIRALTQHVATLQELILQHLATLKSDQSS